MGDKTAVEKRKWEVLMKYRKTELDAIKWSEARKDEEVKGK